MLSSRACRACETSCAVCRSPTVSPARARHRARATARAHVRAPPYARTPRAPPRAPTVRARRPCAPTMPHATRLMLMDRNLAVGRGARKDETVLVRRP